MIKKIMDIMNTISYGFLDEEGNNLLDTNPENWDEKIYLLKPEELLEKKFGVCFDQVELERKLFESEGINVQTFFICTYDNDNLPSHTFLTYHDNNFFYWFEHSWFKYQGIHQYSTLKELLLDVKEKFIASHDASKNAYTFVYEYQKPPFHINCYEFYQYMETQKLMKLNEPLYFYHVVDKDADLSKGLLSLQYMYDHKLYDLFEQHASKYKKIITNDWNLIKYKDKEYLTREEILDALKIFRGEFGASYIYFFKYPPFKELGKKIEKLLEVKDIYRININDEEIQKNIKDIFYGFDMSNSDNKVLDKTYYENIIENEYFKNYDDYLEMNFSRLNHISIAFQDDYCKKEFLEKVS